MDTLFFTSFLAGVLSILNPCVLPVAPIILMSAWQRHRLAPLALVSGISLTFTAVGMALAMSGAVLGFEGDTVRFIFAALMVIFGVLLISNWLQERVAAFLSLLTQRLQQRSQAAKGTGLWGQFILGILVGGAWLPCTGPTLGVAITLAAKGGSEGSLLTAAFIMLTYSLGTSLPLVIFSYASRGLMARRLSLMRIGQIGRKLLGYALLLVGGLILTDFDLQVQAWLISVMPQWWMNLTILY